MIIGLTGGYLLIFWLAAIITLGVVIDNFVTRWAGVRKAREETRRSIEETNRARLAAETKQAKINARMVESWQNPPTP